jgi:hypothetical protein
MLLDAASTMLLTLHQLLQAHALTQSAQEELSIHSGGALHHIGQLFSHPLMYNATMLVSPGGRHITRLLMSACCLSDLMPGALAGCKSRGKGGRAGAPLGLARAGITPHCCAPPLTTRTVSALNPPPPLPALSLPPTENAASREAIVPLLVARCNSLLVQLSEFRTPTVLDTLCASAPGKARMHYYIATACRLAQRTLSPVPFPEDATEPAKLPPGEEEGQPQLWRQRWCRHSRAGQRAAWF